MSKKTTAVAVVADEKSIEILRSEFPVETSFQKTLLPRIGLASQDVTEEVKNKAGKKEIKVITEAGTFSIDRQGDEVDEKGKKIWDKEEIGSEFEGVILFRRNQLKFYDGKNYTSSPVYDNNDQVLPLFCEKAEVDRGTPAELKARTQYQGVSAKGKPISKLEDNRILYILYKGEIYQMNLRGTSMYAYLTYCKDLNAKGLLPPAVNTRFSSEAKENGAISWNQMTFEVANNLDNDEIADVIARVESIKADIKAENSFFESKKADDELSKF